MKTYKATSDIKIDGYPFKSGDVIGSGEGDGFTPVKGCERIGYGHIIPRLADGIVAIAEQEKTAKTSKATKSKPASKAAKTEDQPA